MTTPRHVLQARQATATRLLDEWWNWQVLPFYAGIAALSIGYAAGGLLSGLIASLASFALALAVRRAGRRGPAGPGGKPVRWARRALTSRYLTIGWVLCTAVALLAAWRRGDLLWLVLAGFVLFPLYRRFGAPSPIEQKAAWAGLQLWARGARSGE